MVQFLSLTSITALLLLSAGISNVSAAATNTCVVAKSSSDDAITIAEAFEKCKTGGTVTFSKGTTYNLKSVVTISGLKNVNINLAGTISLPARSSSWQNGDHYIQLKGDNIKMYGGGTINGNGQAWYDAEDHTAPTVLRISATNSNIGSFSIINAPRAHLGVTNSQNLVLDNITLKTASTSSKLAKNTDALDVSSSSGIIFQNSHLTVGDDCTAINGGVTNITLSNIICNGGHGFSVGSLGKGGKEETVKMVRVYDSTCNNCQNGVRIKTWPGGKGSVSDVIYKNVHLNNVDNPVIVTTHYCDKNQMSYCNNNDASSLSISDVTFNTITGSASSAGNPILNVNCSTKTPCTDFTISGLTVTKTSKTPKNVCVNLSGSSSIAACSS
ncbi:hypothetical protein G6F70_001896 [Rhizopus microsporus]|uniref:Pectin lyase-like protein n=1 Tax=Rhizopus microsporus TaxID=58291 RepID=A0A0A1NHS7_RHIZD|nr:hypothetical protein G6F71_003479 [Rhizopus microsporus]KAG1202864.1 hypothetical protein G6F70_001896 [Rhizopus microsporus]KAG1212972.1 hypothetical protein G6F69_003234 [Rhizopus microsporus]KAG1237537.1 hypothetical protein G6F67_001145 [Rhizopus microsporus]KAG1267176.1 hypothetical protein G6F68_002146 [Rhizopus microsporus]